MCEFASSVITRDKEFYLPNSNSHSEIIRHFGLNEFSDVTGPHIVKIEITPNKRIKTWPSLDQWNYRIDQDILPIWHEENPDDTKTRAFAALALRAKKGFSTIRLAGMHSLKSLNVPKTKTLILEGANKLAEVLAPRAKRIKLRQVPALTTLAAPKATDVTINNCPKLTKLVATAATDCVDLGYNHGLTYVSVKNADSVYVNSCTKLRKLYAPHASDIYISNTPKNISIKAKKGARIHRGNEITVVGKDK